MKKEFSMTQLRKRAILNLIIWGIVLAVFISVFFTKGGPDTYTLDKTRRLITALIVAWGYVMYLTINLVTRKKKSDRTVKDERDNEIQKQASYVTFFLIMIYVFIISIILWEGYHDRGAVPVGWMWFLAYSVVCFSFFISSLSIILFDWKLSGHAQG
jgi:uncharacterized membrane protein